MTKFADFPFKHRKRPRRIGRTCTRPESWKRCRGQEKARDSADQENDKQQQVCREFP